jgi:hypothetical protein
MDHPLYSTDLVPCDFWFFSELKKCPKGTRLADIPDIQQNVTLLQGIPENYFQDCFWQWYHHFKKRIASHREYFKGNSSH